MELLILTGLVWLAYWGVIRCGFVSDDIVGLQEYDGKLKKFDYGHLNKWLLYKLLDKSPVRNHLFSIFLHNANVILLYLFLSSFISPKVAFLTSVLFAIHPVGLQAVAWISGRGYPISLFFCLLGLNILFILKENTSILTSFSIPSALLVLGYGGIYYLSIVAQFATLSTFGILLFLRFNFFAVLGVFISFFAGFGIIKEVIEIRTKTFKEQNLEKSTYFKLSKIITVFKSLAYYTRLCFFPKRLGLYHSFEYHYSEKTEKEDKWFWFGFLIFLCFGILYWYGNTTIRFGILWYMAYVFIFLNWITIHQFVSERYIYIASIGLFTLLSYVLKDFPVFFSFLSGIYLMRTWAHIPTYQDEVSFYQSNVWNFPDSEVAFANLGVTYLKCNLPASAVDMWMISSKINPEFDVPYYNIYSFLRQQGQFLQARGFLEKAIKAGLCHFKELWTKELQQLDQEIQYIQEIQQLNTSLSEAEKDPSKKEQAIALKKQLEEIHNLHKLVSEKRKNEFILIQQEEQSLEAKLVQIKKAKEEAQRPIPIEELIKARNYNFSILKESVNKLLKPENKNETKENRILP